MLDFIFFIVFFYPFFFFPIATANVNGWCLSIIWNQTFIKSFESFLFFVSWQTNNAIFIFISFLPSANRFQAYCRFYLYICLLFCVSAEINDCKKMCMNAFGISLFISNKWGLNPCQHDLILSIYLVVIMMKKFSNNFKCVFKEK